MDIVTPFKYVGKRSLALPFLPSAIQLEEAYSVEVSVNGRLFVVEVPMLIVAANFDYNCIRVTDGSGGTEVCKVDGLQVVSTAGQGVTVDWTPQDWAMLIKSARSEIMGLLKRLAGPKETPASD